MFSIYEWNKYNGCPELCPYKKQDDQLIENLYQLNTQIRDLNQTLNTVSPVFSVDISHNQSKNSKSKKTTPRDQYNFLLYRDGIHPPEQLAKVWLKKVALQIQDDCWGMKVQSAVGLSTTCCASKPRSPLDTD